MIRDLLSFLFGPPVWRGGFWHSRLGIILCVMGMVPSVVIAGLLRIEDRWPNIWEIVLAAAWVGILFLDALILFIIGLFIGHENVGDLQWSSKKKASKTESSLLQPLLLLVSKGLGFTMAANGPVFHLARRNGYDPSGVDDLIDRLEVLPSTLGGYRAAYELVSNARFRLARRNGYDPDEVDDYFDWKLAELTTLLKAEGFTDTAGTSAQDEPETT